MGHWASSWENRNERNEDRMKPYELSLSSFNLLNRFMRMLSIIHRPSILARRLQVNKPSRKLDSLVVCCTRDQKPRFSHTWKTRKRIGITSNSQKLINSIKKLSNVKEEVYGVLDSYIAWELEFPLKVIKKALKTLELQKEWKRLIQVIKWMLSKGQGQSMGTYLTLLNALIEDDRLEEAEKLYTKMFSRYLESLPRNFFAKMIFLYYCKGLNEKMFEIFADMDELRVRPSRAIVRMVGTVFQRLGMVDKYEKLNKKYPPPKWECRLAKRDKYVKLPTKPWSANDDAVAAIEIQELQFNHTDKDDVAPRAILPPASDFGCEAETEIVLEQLSNLVIDETYA